jgi:hypothetical protein
MGVGCFKRNNHSLKKLLMAFCKTVCVFDDFGRILYSNDTYNALFSNLDVFNYIKTTGKGNVFLDGTK